MQCKIVYTGIDIISLERTEDLHQSRLKEKQKEAVQAVLPIVCIVLLLSFTIAPLPTDVLLSFLLGAVMLVIGMMLFNLGADLAMAPMGEQMGAQITRSKKLSIILPIGFLLGFLITISEPDLQVLANQVKSIPNLVLIFAVAGGVGLFLAVVFDITSRATNGKPLIWWSRPWQVLLVLAAAFTNAIAAMNAGLYLGLCLVVVAVLICRALAKAAQRLYSRRRA